MLSVRLQITSVFSGSSITLLYAVAGVDAIRVSLLDWINWRCALAGYSRGSQGEMFGNSQVLGGLASFAAALINSLLSGLSMKAPFIVCVLCLVAVAVWTMRLADDANKYLDWKLADKKNFLISSLPGLRRCWPFPYNL